MPLAPAGELDATSFDERPVPVRAPAAPQVAVQWSGDIVLATARIRVSGRHALPVLSRLARGNPRPRLDVAAAARDSSGRTDATKLPRWGKTSASRSVLDLSAGVSIAPAALIVLNCPGH
jgi:hypothetical protein